jgi:hypothetical protein
MPLGKLQEDLRVDQGLPLKAAKRLLLALTLAAACLGANGRTETPDEWVARGHGAFGAFIPLGVKIGFDTVKRVDAKPRQLAVLYDDGDAAPCACFADGIAIATYASVGHRTPKIAEEKAPLGMAAIIVIRPRTADRSSNTQSPCRFCRSLAR